MNQKTYDKISILSRYTRNMKIQKMKYQPAFWYLHDIMYDEWLCML